MSLILDAFKHGYNPTFGTTIEREMPANMTPAEYAGHVRLYLRSLKAKYNKHERWLTACDAYSAGQGPAPSLTRMPSKTAKHKMYGESSYLNVLMGWKDARCGSLGDISRQIEAIEAALKLY